jgi:uncharacterized protein YodC (DUF2158 family)
MTWSPSLLHEGKSAQGVRFQSGDKVRSVHGSGLMTVIISFDDQVHCEWLIGTEPHHRAFPATSLLLVQRAKV